MRRYLTKEEIQAALHLGKDVEQMLGIVEIDERPVIRYLVISQQKKLFVVNVYERFLPVESDFFDVVEFESVDPDDESTDHEFGNIDDALSFATIECGAQKDKFVNRGMIQDELRDYLRSK